jgi:hypothetical protein
VFYIVCSFHLLFYHLHAVLSFYTHESRHTHRTRARAHVCSAGYSYLTRLFIAFTSIEGLLRMYAYRDWCPDPTAKQRYVRRNAIHESDLNRAQKYINMYTVT